MEFLESYAYNTAVLKLAEVLAGQGVEKNIQRGYMFAGVTYKHAIEQYAKYSRGKKPHIEICWIDIIQKVLCRCHPEMAEDQLMELYRACGLGMPDAFNHCLALEALLNLLYRRKMSFTKKYENAAREEKERVHSVYVTMPSCGLLRRKTKLPLQKMNSL